MSKKVLMYIGLDPGVKTGFAVLHPHQKDSFATETLTIPETFFRLHDIAEKYGSYIDGNLNVDHELCIMVVIEDARKIGGRSVKAQGAGAVKMICGQYEKYCKKLGFQIELVRPGSNMTKCSPRFFESLTGLKALSPGGKSLISEHARDAGLLIYGRV